MTFPQNRFLLTNWKCTILKEVFLMAGLTVQWRRVTFWVVLP